MEEIVIVGAARTPVGSFSGAFANTPAHALGSIAIGEAVKRAKVGTEDVDEVILGQILAAGEGMNPARQAARAAGIPDQKTAFGINQVCGSGLRAVALAAQQVASGQSDIVVAGGQENMTLAPHCANLRAGVKMGDMSFVDTMIKDGLWDIFNGYHMGMTAENVARAYQITREDQDRAEGRALPRRDRSGDGEDAQGRGCGRRRRVHPPRRQHRVHGQAAPRLQQGWNGDCRQRFGHQ
jgi:acetyl-CoA C-acetyltransferase